MASLPLLALPHVPSVGIRNCSDGEASRSSEIRALLNEKRLGTQLDTGCPHSYIFSLFHSMFQLALFQALGIAQGSLQKVIWKSLHQISYPTHSHAPPPQDIQCIISISGYEKKTLFDGSILDTMNWSRHAHSLNLRVIIQSLLNPGQWITHVMWLECLAQT